MGTVDLSRAAFDPKKRYAGVRMQQGRVTLDDDFNEGERIQDDDDRRELIHIIGPAGTPDDGFSVANPTLTGGGFTFDILAGTMYLGGIRVWNPAVADYATQHDWLLQPASERTVPADGQRDLVYLEVWRQAATAVEDAELFEAALAGPDTSARIRTMWRVHRATNVAGKDCRTEWEALVASWTAGGLGTVDPASGERRVDAQLQVQFEPGGPAGDLCSPPVAGGYLGAENQAIRVELVDATHFTWGFDNASPLYRVKVSSDHVTITLDTEPKDRAHWPLAGQIVEILPWSAVLPNNEKLAELSGHLSRVQGSYDPESRTITLTTAVPAGFGEEWTTRGDAGTLAPTSDDRHYYMRVWNRGDDTTSAPAIPFTSGTSVPLGSTGLNVTLTGTQCVRGDHWIIAARPETPDQVVPWLLEHGRPPNGVRRYYTPLALIEWDVDSANGVFDFDLLSDCRKRFPPLTRIQTCCTYTVGDERHSFGMFKTIQDAVNHLPDGGGKICVLPGEYREVVTIDGRHDVTIEGCGRRSTIRVPEGEDTAGIYIIGSRDITIRTLGIDAGDRPGIVILDALGAAHLAGPTDGGPVRVDEVFGAGERVSSLKRASGTLRVLLEGLTILASAFPAVAAYGGRFITLRESLLFAEPLSRTIGDGNFGRWPSVVMLSDDVLIEENEISATASPSDSPTQGSKTFTLTAMGGIQIGGGSERVEIRRNKITGGNGDGVTLGSVAWVSAPQRDLPFDKLVLLWSLSPSGFGLVINDDGCIEIDWDPTPPDDDQGNPMVPISMGDLRDIRIVDNTIVDMGRGGVGVARFWDLKGEDEIIRVDRLTVENNRMTRCLRLPIPELPKDMTGEAGQGVITLADGEIIVIRDNVIEENGRSHVDPVCGVFALRAAGISVERNRIVDNAPRVESQDPPRLGFRGGVVVLAAVPPAVEIEVGGQLEGLRSNGVPSARIVGNIIAVPEGRCVVLLGLGTMTITDNQLTSRGVGTANFGLAGNQSAPATLHGFLDQLGGCTVLVLNGGRSNELGAQLALWQKMIDLELEPAEGLDPTPAVLAGGDVMFSDNQATLDLMETRPVAVISSVALLSLDDVQCSDNQLTIEQDRDIVATHILGLGYSFRLTGNRIEETLIVNNEITQGLSAFVFSPIVTATSNQSTHCLFVIGVLRVFENNIQVLQAFDPKACGGTGAAGEWFNDKYMHKVKS